MKRWSAFSLEHFLLVLILFAAVFFRFFELGQVPPGMTHDEANNVHDAAVILDGVRPFYFPVAQGKEPLYIYSAGGLMALVGRTPWVLRFSSAIWGILLLVLMVAWVKRAFDINTALATGAGLAVCFWPVTTARLGLRAVTLPVLFTAFSYLFWLVTQWPDDQRFLKYTATQKRSKMTVHGFLIVSSGTVLGACIYTYLASRLIFLIIIPFLLYLALFSRPLWSVNFKRYLLIIGIAVLVMAPLIFYLNTHPSAEIRIDQLDRPLRLILAGDAAPLLDHIQETIRIFSFQGDTFVPYNIPGKPLLEPIIALFFYAGLILALWEWKRPACMYALLWFLIGMIPAMATGVEAANLRLYLIQPVVFLFSALAWVKFWEWVEQFLKRYSFLEKWGKLILVSCMGALIIYGAFLTYSNYFIHWAEAPDVRVHYHVDLIEIAHAVERHPGEDIMISTAFPGEYHDPRVVKAQIGQDDTRIRWFNGQRSFVIPPAKESIMIVPFNTQISPLYKSLVNNHLILIETVTMRLNDFAKGFSIYRLDMPAVWVDSNQMPLAKFGEQLVLNSTELIPKKSEPGSTVELITDWTILGRLPDDRDGKLFVHLLDPGGEIIVQDDRLDVPSWNWRPGDRFFQLFQLPLPENLDVGNYRIIIGAYTQADRVDAVLAGHEPNYEPFRLLVTVNGVTIGDCIELETILEVSSDR